ncbi:hypothetical protein CesoFtcFv8_005344 [Champsocephalus esox]|uniref:Uncharacterized protein n=1 Tax=Champsocephalus esox TaxID=159716 RepID=A0AAN8CPJ6_9TELE|nr:hypothetical protein CesoFtcFv8_005344 [Champsocephalus esox]
MDHIPNVPTPELSGSPSDNSVQLEAYFTAERDAGANTTRSPGIPQRQEQETGPLISLTRGSERGSRQTLCPLCDGGF